MEITRRYLIPIVSVLLTVFVFQDCTLGNQERTGQVEGEVNEEVIRGTGMIRYVSLEGGFYAIFADNGERYDPVNLQSRFKQDGLRVTFVAKKRKGLMSFHMWGDALVEVLEME